MNELRAPVYDEPTKPLRKYHRPGVDGAAATVTTEMYAADRSKHLPVNDDFEWKLELAQYASKEMEWQKKKRDWTENSARTYHLVLLHCSPGLVAQLKNHSR